MTTTAPIENAVIQFDPNVQAGMGGRITLKKPVSGKQVLDAYIDWFVGQTTHQTVEVAWDESKKTLFVGAWQIDVEFDPELIDFQLYDYVELPAEAEEPSQEQPAKIDTQPAVRDILDPKPQLEVARVLDDGTMHQARAMVRAATIAIPAHIRMHAPVGAVVPIDTNTGFKPLETMTNFSAGPAPKGRVMIANQPEKQRRDFGQTHNHQESNTMATGNNQRRQDERNANHNTSSRGDRTQHNTRYQKPAREHAAQPTRLADPEMINRLLDGGIGAAVLTDDFARDLQSRLQRRRQGAPAPTNDGVDCINVSAAAQTELGKRLRLAEKRMFSYGRLGQFSSLAGLFLMLTENNCQESYSQLHSARASRLMSGMYEYRREYAAVQQLSKQAYDSGARGYYDLRTIYSIMGDALWLVVNQDAELAAALLENHLPLECFVWVKPRVNEEQAGGEQQPMRARAEVYGKWYLPLLREVVRCLRARLAAAQQGVPGEQLPLPNFTQAVELGIQRLRRQMATEMERRGHGYAAKDKPQINEELFGHPKKSKPGKTKQHPKSDLVTSEAFAADAQGLAEQKAEAGDQAVHEESVEQTTAPAQAEAAQTTEQSAVTITTIDPLLQPIIQTDLSRFDPAHVTTCATANTAAEPSTLQTLPTMGDRSEESGVRLLVANGQGV